MSKKLGSLKANTFAGEGSVTIKTNLFDGGTLMALDIVSDWINDLHAVRDVIRRAEYGTEDPEEPTLDMYKDDPIAFMEARLRYEKQKGGERDGL